MASDNKHKNRKGSAWTPRLNSDRLTQEIELNFGKFGYYRPKQAMRNLDVIKSIEHKDEKKHYVLFTPELIKHLNAISFNKRNLLERCKQYIDNPRIVSLYNQQGLVRCDDQQFGHRRCYFKLKISGKARILSTPYKIMNDDEFIGYLHVFDKNDIDFEHSPTTVSGAFEIPTYNIRDNHLFSNGSSS